MSLLLILILLAAPVAGVAWLIRMRRIRRERAWRENEGPSTWFDDHDDFRGLGV